jgi:hypothetical protein
MRESSSYIDMRTPGMIQNCLQLLNELNNWLKFHNFMPSNHVNVRGHARDTAARNLLLFSSEFIPVSLLRFLK